MDLGAATLLELNDAPDGKRLAYCLPTGEFIFATASSARYFANRHCSNSNDDSTSNSNSNADAAHELYGRNLGQFLSPLDIERLEDFMRGHCSRDGRLLLQTSSDLQLTVRVQATGMALSVRIETVPLTLRMSRCIDAVKRLFDPTHLFADASSFVVADDDFGLVGQSTQRSCCASRKATTNGRDDEAADDNDDPFFFASLSSDSDIVTPLNTCGNDPLQLTNDHSSNGLTSRKSSRALLPLELKDSPTASQLHTSDRYGKRTASTASTDIADDDDALGVDDDEDDDDCDGSLAGFAFEAEWASELVLMPSTRMSVTNNWSSLRTDGVTSE